MFWNKTFSNADFWFIGLFIVIYLVYLAKVLYVAIRMQTSARAIFLKLIPRSLAFGLIIIALLEPSFGLDESSAAKANNRNTMILLDNSLSMAAQDISPSRIIKAKKDIKNITAALPESRFGLLSFASEPTLNMPITNDAESLNNSLIQIEAKATAASGTNINEALRMGVEKLKATGNFETSANNLLLLTDGEDFSDITDQTFNDLKRYRIKLITVGVGTKAGTTIQLPNGKALRNTNQKIVTTKLEDTYLISLSKSSNGVYFEYKNQQAPFDAILEAINSTKTYGVSATLQEANKANKYQYPLLLALLLMLFDVFFTFKIFNF
jgi:Ca-activated chloride channel homolog